MGDWQLLARRADSSVSRCPEGHIHIEVGLANLKLDEPAFLQLAAAVREAAHRLGLEDTDRPVALPSTAARRGSLN